MMNKKRIKKIAGWFFGSIAGLLLLFSLLLFIFKKDIINYIVGELNKNLVARVEVGKIDLTFWNTFPNVSIDFKKVLITDSVSPSVNRDTVIYSDRIRLKFNAMKLWKGTYELKSAEISPGVVNLKVYPDGRINYAIIKSDREKSTESKFDFELKKVLLRGVRFSYWNGITGQHYASKVHKMWLKGNFNEKQFTLRSTAWMYLNWIKNENVTLLKNKPVEFDIALKIDQQKGSFELPNARILISKLPFLVDGYIDPGTLRFDVKADNLKLEEVATKLSSDIRHIDQYRGKGTFNFNLKIRGNGAKNVMPVVVCDFGIHNGSLREPSQNININSIYLQGKYSNEAGKNKEYIRLSPFRFNTSAGPFSGEFLLTNFSRPHYKGHAEGNIDLKSVHALFHIPYIETIDGKLGVKAKFDIRTVTDKKGNPNIAIDECLAQLALSNINATVKNDTRSFNSLNGAVDIRNDEASLQDISVRIGSSDFRLSGLFQNIAPYITKTGILVANIDLASHYIDTKDLSSTTIDKSAGAQSVPLTERNFILPSDIRANLLVNIGQLKYGSHFFRQLKSSLQIEGRRFIFNSMNVENAGARVTGDLSIEETSPELLLITSNLYSNNLYFKPLFQEWNNFDQHVITENNINGKAQVDLHFKAPFDLRSGIIKNEIMARVYLRIEDGSLKNVSSFKSMVESMKTSGSAKLVLGKRNIDELSKRLVDLKFDVLENTFTIQKGRVDMPEMKINSSALNISAFAWHNFKNEIDYHFAFRFRDLKTFERNTEFGQVEDDGTGMNVFVRMSGTVSNPVFSWDKASRKEQARENRQEAKKEAFSILKSEFGFKKKDTTIQYYQQEKKPKEELKIDFGSPDDAPEVKEKKESEFKKKLKEKMNKMKKESENEVEFQIGN